MSNSAAILWTLRSRLLRNGLRLLWSGSMARTLAVVISCLVTWVSLFVFSMYSFGELKSRWDFPLNGWFQELLFDLMFFFLSTLLFFSTGILLYSALFSAPESRYLLTTPLPDDHLFAYRFQGALAFSNWGFLLLGSPVLIAYGFQVEPAAPWTFFVHLPLFFLGFVLMPGSLGAVACLLLVNFLPKSWAQMGKLAAGVVGVIGLVAAWRMMGNQAQGFQPTRLWFEGFINELTILSGNLQPHHWVAAGLRSAALGETSRTIFYLALVWSNGLLLYIVAVWLGRRLFRRGVERVITGGTLFSNRVRHQWLDRVVERSLVFLDQPTRLLIIKDFRTFRRDPAQWLQILIFVGLLLFYFWGMKRFFERDIGAPFRNGISMLTLTATSLLMCAYTGRFIFPLLSLEGRTFWLLGLLPLNRSRLLVGKFAFAAFTCLCPCLVLIVTCDQMLGVPTILAITHIIAVVLVALGLSGISVGLGTLIPNFRESDPSKIAIGFGGTLNLVVGFLYIMTVLGLVTLPLHLFLAGKDLGFGGAIPWFLWVLCGAGVLIGLLGAYLPLRWGAVALEKMEF